MKAPVYDLQAKLVSQISLPPSVFAAKISPHLVSQAIRVYRQNQRKAHAKTKDRSQVSGSTRKIWAQKGTGRARHGSRKAPIFVKGGVAHGPTGAQNYSRKMSKKMKKQAVFSVLSQFAKQKRILIINQFKSFPPKTKDAVKLIKALSQKHPSLSSSKKIGIIINRPQTNLKRAFDNLKQISLLNLSSLNSFQLANQNFLVFSLKAVKKLSSA